MKQNFTNIKTECKNNSIIINTIRKSHHGGQKNILYNKKLENIRQKTTKIGTKMYKHA